MNFSESVSDFFAFHVFIFNVLTNSLFAFLSHCFIEKLEKYSAKPHREILPFALNRLIHQIKNEVNLWHRNKLHYTCVTVGRQVFMTNVPMGNHPIKGQVFHEYLTICWLFLYRFQADLCMHNAMIIRGITFADDVGNVRICVSMEISLLTFDFNFSFGLFGPRKWQNMRRLSTALDDRNDRSVSEDYNMIKILS